MGGAYSTTIVKEFGYDVATLYRGNLEAARETRQADWEAFLRTVLAQQSDYSLLCQLTYSDKGDFIRLKAETWNAFSKEDKETLVAAYLEKASEFTGQVKNYQQKVSHDFFGGGLKFAAIIEWVLSPQIDGKVEWDIVIDGNGQIQKFMGTYHQNGEYNI